jgi:hypothetical protein
MGANVEDKFNLESHKNWRMNRDRNRNIIDLPKHTYIRDSR